MKKINNKKVDYEFIVLHYLKSYSLSHTENELISIMRKMIKKEGIKGLPVDLKNIDKNTLSMTVSKIVLKYIKKENKEHDFLELLPSIISTCMMKPEKKKKISYSLKRKFVSGTIIALSTLSTLSFLGKNNKVSVKNNNNEISKESFYDTENNNDVDSISLSVGANERILINSELIKNLNNPLEDINKYSLVAKTNKEMEEEQLKNKKRDKILNGFKKCKTLEDILKRQRELKSLNMTDDDKIYKDCPLSPELQRFIYEQSIIYGYPVDFTFSIIYTETRGEFNSSGKVSYNYGNNYDMGLTQQNSESSAKMFAKKFNMNYDDTCYYLRYNDYVNVVSAFVEYQEIASRRNFDPEEFAGCYNGWLNWRRKDISREYVDIFNKAYYDKYKQYHKIIKR